MPLLDVRGLEKYYGRRKVVNGVTFDVNQGESSSGCLGRTEQAKLRASE